MVLNPWLDNNFTCFYSVFQVIHSATCQDLTFWAFVISCQHCETIILLFTFLHNANLFILFSTWVWTYILTIYLCFIIFMPWTQVMKLWNDPDITIIITFIPLNLKSRSFPCYALVLNPRPRDSIFIAYSKFTLFMSFLSYFIYFQTFLS
jgi:hypothetical protein